MSKIAVLGAGNVAAHFSLALKDAGYSVIQVFGRTEKSAGFLAEKLNCPYTVHIKNITVEADFYIFAVKDDALQNIIIQMPLNSGIWIHTAGSVSMDVFNGFSDRYGVIYPLQTLSKDRKINFRKVPLFIEANSPETENIIKKMATSVSETVKVVDSEKRKYLHLAAVFACNFTNHCYAVASEIVEKQGMDRNILQPLIDETANKPYSMTPLEAQTGPAVRNDKKTMEKHIEMIENKDIKEIYKLISQSISTLNEKK